MKKLLTILILLLAVASQGWADREITLWEGSTALDWNASQVVINNDLLKLAEIGSIIKIEGSNDNSGSMKLCVNSPSWDTLEENIGTFPYSYTVNSDKINSIKKSSLTIQGANVTITKVTMTIPEEFIVWEGSVPINWGATPGVSLDIDGEYFSNLEIGSQIVVTGTQTSGQLRMSKRYPWVDLVDISSDLSLPYTYTVPYEYADKITTDYGLSFQGQGVTITKIEKKESNVIWLATTGTLENVNVVSRKLENIAIGNRLKITKTNKESLDGTLSVSYNNGTEKVEVCSMQSWNGEKEIEVTSTNIDYIKQNGLYLTGSNLAESKIELDTSDPEAVSSIDPTKFVKLWNTAADDTPAPSITFSSQWGGAGWNIGDDKYNKAQSITVALSAAPTTLLNLVLEYVTTDGAVLTNPNPSDYGNSTDGFTASSTVSVPQSDLLKIRKLYIQNPNEATTITLSSVKIATSVLNNDMSVYEVASSVFSSALVGDKIKITYSSISSGDMTLKVGTTDGGTDVLASGTVTGTSKEIEITASTLADIKSNGLYLRGNNITIESVELVSVPPFTGDDNSKTANLARFVADGATYDGNGTITTTNGYEGIKLTLSEGQYVSGTRLIVNFQSATNAKVHVNYVDKGWDEGSENTGDGTQLIVPLNISNQVSEVIIQITTAGTTATLTGVSIDNICMLTTTAVNGSISMTYTTGGGSATGTEFPYGTGLTLTATANEHFAFSKWKKNGEDAESSSPLDITMDGNVSVDALFKATPLNNDETLTVWSGATTGQSWGEELQITSEITDILERFETIKITASRITPSPSSESPNYKVFLSTLGTTEQIGNFECNGVTDGQVEFSLSTDALVNLLKGGFGICVQNTKITKVELYKPIIPVALEEEGKRTVWSNSTGVPLNWGNNEIFIPALDAHILEAGEQVIITTEKTRDWPKAWLADGSAAVSPTIEGTECKITLTSALVDQIKNGFYVSGGDATAKKIEFYKPVVIFIDGKANLDRGTESSGSTTLTAPHDEAVTGNVMVVNLTETNPDAKVKVTYSDGSSIEIAPSKRKVGTPTATQVVVPLNMEKYIKSVSVNTAKAKISEIYMTTISAFEADASNFVADLSLAKAQDNVLYNPSTYTIAASTGWTGIALSKNSADADIKGAEVKITFEGDAQVKTTVYYTDDTNTGDAGSMSEAASSQKLKIDATKTIREIQIQPTSASVVQLKEVRVNATETEDEPEGGDEEAVIDKETGEADLTELSAQDDTKTTLTQNEDGSITMTTTEAYCAAQIWFNDPEPVAGNVLKVELAESSVNVTVTVKYTDGTESQMNANTMVAKARGVTRAVSSGSTIEVPLDAGKEVQNIEVKNNVAGTITIKKMQVTTVNVFTNGVANLSMLKPQSNATYDTAAHTLATTKGWTGATISPVANENVSGKELLIEFADASKVKVAVKYRTDVEGPSTIMEKAAKAVRLALDNSKNIQEISIQPTEAAIVTFTKIAVNSEETDDGSLKPGKTITLWESATGETLAWNEVAKQDASVGEMLKEYDELLITVSGVVKDCDWPKLFIRDASSEQAGNEVLLNDIGSFPYTVRIVLTGEMAQQLQKGFSICGDGVTVKKLQVYRPEAPKTGDIHLADLNYGYNSSYDKGTHTITTTARWAARGWEIGDKRYNDKNLITVKFEAVDFPVTLKMEYTTGLQTAQATSVGVPAGRTELLLEIPKGISKLNRVYIIYENPGKVKLTEASVTYMENLKLSTAIQAFEADGVIRDGRYDTDGWYNLRGMRIPEPTTSGIYIHGGKKVVIY